MMLLVTHKALRYYSTTAMTLRHLHDTMKAHCLQIICLRMIIHGVVMTRVTFSVLKTEKYLILLVTADTYKNQ